jgi:hypothetical protein
MIRRGAPIQQDKSVNHHASATTLNPAERLAGR